MKVKNAIQEFQSFLSRGGTSVSRLTPEAGLEFMVKFYRDVRADECDLDDGGDMLLYQWGTYDFGEGPRFELDITRQFILSVGEDVDIMHLSLTFSFQPSAELRDLGSDERWCRTLGELQTFESHAVGSGAVRAVQDRPGGRVDLDFEHVC